MSNEEWFNVQQVAAKLGVSRRTIFNLMDRGDLTGFKVGREWRFTVEDISAYEKRQRRKAEAEEIIRNLQKSSSEEEVTRPLVYDAATQHKANSSLVIAVGS